MAQMVDWASELNCALAFGSCPRFRGQLEGQFDALAVVLKQTIARALDHRWNTYFDMLFFMFNACWLNKVCLFPEWK